MKGEKKNKNIKKEEQIVEGRKVVKGVNHKANMAKEKLSLFLIKSAPRHENVRVSGGIAPLFLNEGRT
jgi:hypothetical protein